MSRSSEELKDESGEADKQYDIQFSRFSKDRMYNPYFTGRPRSSENNNKGDTNNRQEIIRNIKQAGLARQMVQNVKEVMEEKIDPDNTSMPIASPTTIPSLLPSPEIQSRSTCIREKGQDEEIVELNKEMMEMDEEMVGLNLPHTKSILRQKQSNHNERPTISPRMIYDSVTATSPPAPWSLSFAQQRSRTVSQLSSSQIQSFQVPTSPLVNSSNAGDDHECIDDEEASTVQDMNSRRRTFSPSSLQKYSSMLTFGQTSPNLNFTPPQNQRTLSTSLKAAHQPKRSISSMPIIAIPSAVRTRRLSLASNASSLHRSMVGSFEESILRGRMSSMPSKSLDFTAHIGVLGTGDCKSFLKCPPHMIVPFPACFYSYNNSTIIDSQPSPYVGHVDLVNSQGQSIDEPRRVHSRRHTLSRPGSPDRQVNREKSSTEVHRLRQKVDRRRQRHLEDPRGGYRIPSKGQLQVILKSPSKTAVKLFLIPYDVSEIKPGQKTFIRQRSYTINPSIDGKSDSLSNLVTSPKERPVLRYLIHINICCTSKDRIFLYKDIRVVFANRVPDGHEKLRIEVQRPDILYSQYRPDRPSVPPSPLSSSKMLFDIASNDDENVLNSPFARSLPTTNIYDTFGSIKHPESTMSWIKFDTIFSRPPSRGTSNEKAAQTQDDVDMIDDDTPLSPLSNVTSFKRSTSPSTDDVDTKATFEKNIGHHGFGHIKTESLLSKRLRGLEMKRNGPSNGVS